MSVLDTPVTVIVTRGSRLRRVLDPSTGVIQVVVAIAVFAVGSLLVPGFAAPSSVRSVLVLASFLGIAALGQTLVVLIGGIDLSVPAVIGAGNVIAAKLTGEGVPSVVMVLIVLAVGLLVGVINGFVTQRWSVPALVVTLATGSVVAGAVLLWTNATLTGSAPGWLVSLTSPSSNTGILPVAPVVLVWLVIAVILFGVLKLTKIGHQLYAVGVNRSAAKLMLASDRRISIFAFGLAGAISALAGMLLTGFTGAGLYTVGNPYLFLSIAAVVVGGTSLVGGRGGPLQSVVGTIVLIQLTTLLVGFHLTSSAQEAILGIVIVIVVAFYGRERKLGDRI
jgi:ribose transport system permease protein